MLSLALGLSDFGARKELILLGSLAVIAHLIHQLLKNLALSAANLGIKYLNRLFVV